MNDFDFLNDLRETSAYELARMAECGALPDSPASLGAELLTEVRDAVVARWEAGRFDWDSTCGDDELIIECQAEGIISDMWHERMEQLLDLGGYMEQCDSTSNGEWSGSIWDIAGDALAQITYRAASAYITQARADFTAKFECVDCGDCGTPHVCFPGECNGSDEGRAAWAASKAAEVNAEAILTTQVPIDPLVTLIAQVEAERASGGSETQAWLARAAKVNAEEFGSRDRTRWIIRACLGALVLVGIVAVGMVIFG